MTEKLEIPISTQIVELPIGEEGKHTGFPDDILKLRAQIDALALKKTVAELEYEIAVAQLKVLEIKIKLADAEYATTTQTIGGGMD